MMTAVINVNLYSSERRYDLEKEHRYCLLAAYPTG